MNKRIRRKVTVIAGDSSEGWQTSFLGTGKTSWIYFGKDIHRFQSLKRTMAQAGRPINAGEFINRVAHEFLTTFINFDRHVEVDTTSLWWQASDLAERNPYTSDFFFNCCTYLAFIDLLENLDGNLLTFAESNFLGRLMARKARAEGCEVYLICNGKPLNRIKEICQEVGDRFRLWRDAYRSRRQVVLNFLAAQNFLRESSQNGHPRESRLKGSIDVLVVTWGEKGTFSDGDYKKSDKYYGVLPGILRKQGFKLGYLVNPYPLPLAKIIESSKTSPDQIVFPDECWTLMDVLKASMSSLFLGWRTRPGFGYRGHDLTPILIRELAMERAKSRQCSAIKHYYVGRFLRDQGIRPQSVLFPFENQPWEKALRLGIAHYLPGTKVVGYMHSTVPSLWLSLHVSQRDVRARQIPDDIVTSGPAWTKILCNNGFPAEIVETGPAFRYSHLWSSERQKRKPRPSSRVASSTILVAGSHAYSDSLELIQKVVEGLRDSSNTKVLIKFHPDMGHDTCSQLLETVIRNLGLTHLPEHFSVRNSPISELLPTADMVIENGTSVAVEALWMGIPVVHVRPDLWFDMNALDRFPGMIQNVRSPEELRAAVDDPAFDRRAPLNSRLKPREDVLTDIFSPISDDTVNRFLARLAPPVTRMSNANPRSSE